ncbi:MAG: hypothetical protein AAF865_01055 [Pseudomonadota bacterium]
MSGQSLFSDIRSAIDGLSAFSERAAVADPVLQRHAEALRRHLAECDDAVRAANVALQKMQLPKVEVVWWHDEAEGDFVVRVFNRSQRADQATMVERSMERFEKAYDAREAAESIAETLGTTAAKKVLEPPSVYGLDESDVPF